jgi:hypothetical protein
MRGFHRPVSRIEACSAAIATWIHRTPYSMEPATFVRYNGKDGHRIGIEIPK